MKAFQSHLVRALAVGIISLVLATGCAYYVPVVGNDTSARFVLRGSAKHVFLDRVAFVDEDSGQLVVYGKVSHNHDQCPSEGRVRLEVVDAAGKTWAQQTMPIVNRGAKRGWEGASFRTRIDGAPPKNSELRLSFQDVECSREGIVEGEDAERANPGKSVKDHNLGKRR